MPFLRLIAERGLSNLNKLKIFVCTHNPVLTEIHPNALPDYYMDLYTTTYYTGIKEVCKSLRRWHTFNSYNLLRYILMITYIITGTFN